MNQEEPTIIKHPYSQTRSLEEFKDSLFYIRDIETNKLEPNNLILNSPLLTTYKNIYPIKSYLKDIGLNYALTNPELFTETIKSNGFNWARVVLENDTTIKELISYIKENQKEPNQEQFRFLIVYYFYDVNETEEEKAKIIKDANKFIYPKKFIYDFIDNKESTEDITTEEKLFLNYGINEKEFYKFFFEDYFKKTFTTQGQAFIKDLFLNLPKEPFKYDENFNLISDYITPEHEAFNNILLNLNILFNAPSIKNYIDLLKYNRDKKKESIDKTLELIEALDIIIYDNLSKLKANREDLEKYIEDKEKESFKEILTRDLKRLDFITKYPNFEKYEEWDKYFMNLRKNENNFEEVYINVLDQTQLSILNEEACNNFFKAEEELKEATNHYKEKGSKFFIINSIIEQALNQANIKRNVAKVIEEQETALNKKAYYDNNVFNESAFSGIALKTLKGQAKIEALAINETLKEAINKSESLNKIKDNLGASYEEQEQARRDLEELNTTIKDLESNLSNKNIIIINGEAKQITTYGKKGELKINIPNNSIDLILEDFKRCYPINFTIDTIKNKKPFEAPYDISFLTPDKGGMAEKLSAFTYLIIREASNVKGSSIILNINNIARALKYGTSQDALKKLKTNLAVFCTILKKTEYRCTILKGSKKGSILNFSLISSYVIDPQTNELLINFDTKVKEIMEKNTSKTWLKDSALEDPTQIVILGKTNSLMNMDNQDDYIVNNEEVRYKNSKNVAIINLAKIVPSIADTIERNDRKHLNGDMQVLYNSLLGINMRQDTPIIYSNLEGVKTAQTVEDLNKRNINIQFKNPNDIPIKMQERAKFKTQQLKQGTFNKHAKGFKRTKKQEA